MDGQPLATGRPPCWRAGVETPLALGSTSAVCEGRTFRFALPATDRCAYGAFRRPVCQEEGRHLVIPLCFAKESLNGCSIQRIIALLVAALVIWIVSKLNLGLTVKGYVDEIIAAIVIAVVTAMVFWLLGLLNITIGGGLLGWIVMVVIAAVILRFSDRFLPGMEVHGFKGAIIVAIGIGVVSWIMSYLLEPPRHHDLIPVGPSLRREA